MYYLMINELGQFDDFDKIDLLIPFLVLLIVGLLVYVLWIEPRVSKKRYEKILGTEIQQTIDDSPYPAKLKIDEISSRGVDGTITVIVPRDATNIIIHRHTYQEYRDNTPFVSTMKFTLQFSQGDLPQTWTWNRRCKIKGVPVYIDEIQTEFER